MEQILLAQKTAAAIMMFYKNTKVKVCFLDGDADISVHNLPRLCISNFDGSNFYTNKRQEADNTPHKLLWTQTMLMT